LNRTYTCGLVREPIEEGRIDVEIDWESIVATGWGFAHDDPRFIEYFQDIASQNRASARAIFELANALDYLGREAEAIPLYEEALRLELPAEYQAYALIQLGSSLRNVGRAKEAVELLAKAEQAYPEYPSISIFLGLSLYSEGRHAEASKTVMEAMLRNVHTTDMQRYARGMEYYIKEIK
jgi:tetratricopeptide (TPR) repeat protein